MNITQKWGVRNPAYDQFGFKNHNGIDLTSGYANQQGVYMPKKWPVWCPVENFTVHMVRNNSAGSGKDIWLISKEKLQMGDKLCYAYLGFAHADYIFLKPGDTPALGEMIMVADNTGFSTGPHTHIGLYRVEWDGKIMTFLDTNESNGSYDPALFFTDKFAVDLATLGTLMKSSWRYYQYLMGL